MQRNFLHLGEIPNSSEEVQQVRLEEVRWKFTKLHEGVDETEKPGSIFKMLIVWLGQLRSTFTTNFERHKNLKKTRFP